MRLVRPVLLLLSVCLVAGEGCGRKKRVSPAGPPVFTPEAVQQIVEAEKSPQASLELLNDSLKDWLLRNSKYPKDLQEFVTVGVLPRLPAPPPGKRFAIDTQRACVVLVADQ